MSTPLPLSALRWHPPRSWLGTGRFASDEPALLWGQERLLSSLDVLSAASLRSEHPLGLDLQTPGEPGELEAVRSALAARMPGRVDAVTSATEVDLRGRDALGPLASRELGAIVVDAWMAATVEGVWGVLREILAHGVVTSLADDRPRRHRCHASVVLVGPDSARKALREKDPGYDDLWLERVALLPDLPRDAQGVAVVTARLRALAEEYGVGELTAGALSFLVEELAGRPSRRARVGLRLGRAERALLTARAWQPEGPLAVAAVRRAWDQVAWRAGVQEESHRNRLVHRQLQVRTDGRMRGVVNGLMVYGSGDGSYCVPGRISARVAVGREGLVNIEREAKYSGRSFDKGMLHLAGWLRGTFAGNAYPLGLAASMAFEQSYGKIDGDSATLAEGIALLSELTGLPVRQDVAVTGAITQRGELLPVGSVNLKVRGWWESCRAHGPLTGTQGVLLPGPSLPDLQLDRSVLTDVRAGRFHLWSADRIEDAAELLLERPSGSGQRNPGADTVMGMAARRLRVLSERLYPPRRSNGKAAPPEPSAPPSTLPKPEP